MKKKTLIFFSTLFLLSCNQTIDNPIQHFEKSPKQKLTHPRMIDLEAKSNTM